MGLHAVHHRPQRSQGFTAIVNGNGMPRTLHDEKAIQTLSAGCQVVGHDAFRVGYQDPLDERLIELHSSCSPLALLFQQHTNVLERLEVGILLQDARRFITGFLQNRAIVRQAGERQIRQT